MLGVYLFALVVGGGLLLFSILGDVFGGGDLGDGGAEGLDLGGADVGGDALDLGGLEGGAAGGEALAHVDTDAAHSGDVHPGKIVSLRTATYFLFGFGGVGTLLSMLTAGQRPFLSAGLGVVTGLLSAGIAAAAFRWLAATESGETEGEVSFVGLPGRVSVPLLPGRSGKVRVHRGERVFELLARPFDPSVGDAGAWRSVVVVEMERGTALVAPLEEDLAEAPDARPET